MPAVAGRPSAGIDPAALLEALERQLEPALARARARGESVLVSVCSQVSRSVDPTAVVALSRRADEPWFCLEQPDRDRSVLAALGCVRELVPAASERRFEEVDRAWRSLVARALVDAGAGPPGSGLAAVGGFAFAPDGCETLQWQGFPTASLIVPEITLARRGEEVWLTANVEVAADELPEDVRERVARRLDSLQTAPLPLLDPAPAGSFAVHSVMPPSHYETAVARAIELITSGEVQKLVLAREVDVKAPAPYDPAALLGVLREAFPACYVFAVGRGEATFLAASPELLVRREGQRASTVALAGSSRRSADPAVDDHLGEQLLRSDKDREENAIVARRISRALSPHSVWVTAAPEPALARVANIQHLATPIRAQLAAPVSAVALAGALHPTPAVGAEPREVGLELIPALEGMDRGWYAGPIGWVDAQGDGEFCVALRCALLRGAHARCYAGCGIVRDSVPTAELAESEVKLAALLPLLAG